MTKLVNLTIRKGQFYKIPTHGNTLLVEVLDARSSYIACRHVRTPEHGLNISRYKIMTDGIRVYKKDLPLVLLEVL